MDEEGDLPDISPVDCARQLLDDVERANDIALSELVDISYMRLALMVCPGVKTIIPSENELFYEVDANAANWLAVSAQKNRDAFDMVAEVCRANIWTGKTIPEAMRPICTMLITREMKPPPRRGPKPGANFGLFFIVYHLGRYLSDAYGMPVVRGDGYEEHSAADAVSTALNERGVAAKYTKVRDYLSHGKHSASRNKSECLRDMMYEPWLRELGLVSRHLDFSMSPFGLFLPLGRIT